MPRRLAAAFLFAVRVAETVDRISPLTPRQIEQRIEDPLRVIVPDGDLFRAMLERIKAGLPVGELILCARVAIQAHQLAAVDPPFPHSDPGSPARRLPACIGCQRSASRF